MRKIKIISGAVLLGVFVWACSDSATTSDDDDTVTGADAGKDSQTTGDDSTGDDDDTTDATTATDSSSDTDGSTATDSGMVVDSGPSYTVGGNLTGLFVPVVGDAGADSGVADSGVADGGVADGGVADGGKPDAGPDAGPPPPPANGLVLQNSAGDDLILTANGAFTFAKKVNMGGVYAVTVKTQPSAPSQTCVVTNGSGTVNANVTNVAVACTRNKFAVGGTVSGLTAGTLVLQNNAGDDKTITANGMYSFATQVDSGNAYSVTVKTQPAGTYCKVSNASGVVGAALVGNVDVACTPITALKNCAAIKTFDATAPSGVFDIDPDGTGAGAAIKAYCDMTTNSGGWTLIYDQDINYGGAQAGYLPIASWATTNATNPNSGQYSIISSVSSLKSAADYEFLLTWSGGSVAANSYAQWKQTQDPNTVNMASTVTFSNYTSSPANLAGCGNFQGLAKHTSAFMAGERGCYWFSVGAPSGYLNGNPAYNTGTGVAAPTAAQRTKLWVR